MRTRLAVSLDWVLPAVVLLGLTIPFWTTDLDVSLTGRFYTPDAGWTHKDEQPWDALYHFGVIPAWVLSLGALAVLGASFRARRLRPYRRAAAFLVLVMAVGPGLLVNNAFKQNWGRPRPRDIYAFGGDRAFVPVWAKSPPANGNSFASGHAATGFYLMAPYFLLRRRSRAWAAAFFLLGVGFGSLMGVARMAQGAHFPSDVLWAFGLVYLTGLAFLYLLRLEDPR